MLDLTPFLRDSRKEGFTAEAPSSQSLECLFIKNSLLRVLGASAVQSPRPALYRSQGTLLVMNHNIPTAQFRGGVAVVCLS